MINQKELFDELRQELADVKVLIIKAAPCHGATKVAIELAVNYYCNSHQVAVMNDGCPLPIAGNYFNTALGQYIPQMDNCYLINFYSGPTSVQSLQDKILIANHSSYVTVFDERTMMQYSIPEFLELEDVYQKAIICKQLPSLFWSLLTEKEINFYVIKSQDTDACKILSSGNAILYIARPSNSSVLTLGLFKNNELLTSTYILYNNDNRV